MATVQTFKAKQATCFSSEIFEKAYLLAAGFDGGVFRKLRQLREAYGWKFLAMLACSQWLVKGMVWGFSLTTMDFLLRDYSVPGPKIQVYRTVAMLPWAMKPLFGLISDALPICGYRKAPYIMVTSLIAVLAHLIIGLDAERSLQVQVIVGCLLLGTMQVSVADLLTEAQYAAKIRQNPEQGPDLLTYVWGGITVGNFVATACVGWIIELMGASRVYAVVALPAALILIPTSLNWLEEKKTSYHSAATDQAKLSEQPELVFLALLMGAATILLVSIGLVQHSVWINLYVALAVSAAVITAFSLLLRPVIGRMNCFFFIQTCCAVDISGAVFYFFTDGPASFPGGPHFSTTFYASGLGMCVAILNLVGMSIYNRFMQTWRYHGLFIFANLLLCIVNLIGILVYTRTNVRLGISDAFFVLGTWGTNGIVQMWMWLPGIVLLSQLCPSGVEATMYALLAGCHNLGLSVSSYAGACVLEALGVAPRGAPNEGKQFENLWIAALVQAVAPVLTLVLLPCMIPNALQTDKLLDTGDSAVEGSPCQRLRARRQDPSYGAV